MAQKPNEIVLFHSEDGAVHLNVQLGEETVWLTQSAMAELFGCSTDNISLHLQNIVESGELCLEATTEDFSVVRQEGTRQVSRNIKHYNLDAIIAVGYRVNSKRATQFRIWATGVLKEYIIKGFALNDERLKNGGGRYFRELLQRIRDIRSSERNLYQQVTDIYVTAIDYDPKADMTREFFATVQNKMHFAAHKHTAAELDRQLLGNRRDMFTDKGRISHKQAVKKAEKEFETYRAREMRQLESDFDRAVKQLLQKDAGSVV